MVARGGNDPEFPIHSGPDMVFLPVCAILCLKRGFFSQQLDDVSRHEPI